MWFKNLQIYRLVEPFPYNAEQLQQRLEERKAKPCHKMSLFSYGWVSPFGDDSDILVHGCAGYLLLAAQREERILPPSVIRDALIEKIKKIETEEDRSVFAKEKKSLRDEVIFDLMPKAFTQKKITYAYIDPKLNCIIIDASSHQQAEAITKLLRDSIFKFDIRPLETKTPANEIMTEWLLNDKLAQDFQLDDSCELVDPKSSGIVRCHRHDLNSRDILQHVQHGKMVSKLGLAWDEKISCVLCEDFSIKRVRYLDLLKNQSLEIGAETKYQQLDADFSLMAGEITHLLTALFAACGGLNPIKSTLNPTAIAQPETVEA
ncbi:MAG: recombination-associated protein RdgC [Legionellales bacterium]|nr:recombination-associated protein RdgC [Legionellales bacterium]